MHENDAPSYGDCFKSLALGLAPLFIISGAAAMFGANTVRVNRLAVHGPLALVYSVALLLIMALLFAAFQKLGYFLLGTMRGRAPATDA